MAETAHFKIMYPQRIAGIEDEAAAIAEESYRVLSENLDVEFNYKIRVYLSDEDEVNNGFAVPFRRAYTDIWVNLNDYSEIWTGSEKWLRKVLAHELAHIFHFEAVKGNAGLLQNVFATPRTRFWSEGLAQYQTEYWDSQRGDRWLRKAVFDDNLNYNSGQALDDGRLVYALGNSQLRYFTEKYGDSTLVNMLKYRDTSLGFIKYHDFYEAFDKAVDGGYSAFFDDWRKHTNVYYNTLASRMERVDSLDGKSFGFPATFLFDAAVSPNDSLVAVLGYPSMTRPVKRLYVITTDSSHKTKQVGEGRINEDLAWSTDGQQLVYSRLVRGEHSSLVNDVFVYDLNNGEEHQITYSRRAKFPVFGPDDDQLSYIVNENGTGNLFTHDLNTGQTQRITNYQGDIQLLWPQWLPKQNSWVFHRFGEAGNRNLVLLNRESGKETILDDGELDNRKVVVNPSGDKLAYVSLRDDVPNVFIYDFETDQETRFTNVFTGAEVFGWVSEFDTMATEHLLVGASESRTKDQLYFVEADRETPEVSNDYVPAEYASWKQKTPPVLFPDSIAPAPQLISDRYEYASFQNITHVTSFALPYYSAEDDWGIFATSNWTEPLGKHTFAGGGWLSIPEPAKNSYGAFSYINNQWYPSISLNVYQMPENGQFYGDRYLFEEYTGVDVTARWPLDTFSGSYQRSTLGLKLRYYHTDPFERSKFLQMSNIEAPQSATIADLELAFEVKKQRPWSRNVIHPLDGSGLRFSLSAANESVASDLSFLKADLNAYTMFPALGLHRVFIQTRLQTQFGNPLPQNYIGFSRYDNITLNLLEQVPLRFFGDNERVRGYRDFVAGDQVAFASMEYRVPFLPSLQTEILGLLKLGSTYATLFTDAGMVFEGQAESGESGTISRWGAGGEVKNLVSLFGIEFVHSLGIAKPANQLFDNQPFEVYYRIKTVVPF